MYDIVSLGELLIDFTESGVSPSGMRLFEQNAGGAVTNLLCAAARCGAKTGFIGKVGRDMHGDFLKKAMLGAARGATARRSPTSETSRFTVPAWPSITWM